MPRCKNDRTKTYAGTEPSPRGVGYCASADPAGKTRKGLDGARWTVHEDKNGRKTWRPAAARGGAATPYGTLARPQQTIARPQTAARPMTRAGPNLMIRGEAAVMNADRLGTQRFAVTQRPGATQRRSVPQRQGVPLAPQNDSNDNCIYVADMARASEKCLDELLESAGDSECAKTMASFACVAAMKVAVDASGTVDPSTLDKVLNVLFVNREMSKPFSVSSDWGTIGKQATRAMLECMGADATSTAIAYEAAT
jgi:hypothetical protein